jgi:hypothetical protein
MPPPGTILAAVSDLANRPNQRTVPQDSLELANRPLAVLRDAAGEAPPAKSPGPGRVTSRSIAVLPGLGHIVALHRRAPASYQIREHIRHPLLLKRQCGRTLGAARHQPLALRHRCAPRARSHLRFALPLIRFIPDSLRESVSLFLERQCDRTLCAPPHLCCLPAYLLPFPAALLLCVCALCASPPPALCMLGMHSLC